ncbi:LysR family transcriptional regulator [Arthrobacter bambusae]|uniref:LysR family transcriptional regulator n=1 Tax=Arthrobacter bambusae TaxID=1338426 RepID=UPI00278171A0|nr:LysR substrate-binding domain-containing protein [Arthrobacter bambusae]MDQ0029064.1 DNA-binding transcriptional LysR family regulator [Arthrobacter bambusae]MDQ0098534.1 DNA-binding transcriptional LysR family regulator [Arthrobacter bambusae]
MEMKQLVAMVTVAEAGSVTHAAQMLHIVQPAVTRQIKTLEDELGVVLFDRTRQGMVLTSAGEVFLLRARRALQEMERARTELTPQTGDVTGLVSVGVLESLLDVIVPPLASSVAKRFPGVELRIMSGFSGYLQKWLDDGVVDIAVLYNLADTPAMRVKPLLSERLWAVAPADAGLLPAEPVTWDRVLRGPLILPILGHGLRTLIDKARFDIPIEPKISLETNSMSVQKQMVLAGRGWTILPGAGVARDIQEGTLSGAPLAEPRLSRSVVVGLQRAARIPRAVEAVNAELLRVSRNLVVSGAWPSATLVDAPKQ